MELATKAKSLIAAKTVIELYYQPNNLGRQNSSISGAILSAHSGMDLSRCIKWCLEQLKYTKDVNCSPFAYQFTSEWIAFKSNDPDKSLGQETLCQIRSFGNMIGRAFIDRHIKEFDRQYVESVFVDETKGTQRSSVKTAKDASST